MHNFNELKQRGEQKSFMRFEYHIINLIAHSTHIPSYEIFFCVAFLSSYIYITDWMSAKWKSDLPHRKTHTHSKWSSEIHIWIFHEFNMLKSVSRSNLDDRPECYFAVFLCFLLVRTIHLWDGGRCILCKALTFNVTFKATYYMLYNNSNVKIFCMWFFIRRSRTHSLHQIVFKLFVVISYIFSFIN